MWVRRRAFLSKFVRLPRLSNRDHCSKMPLKPFKCPDCVFRSRSTKGVKVHWRSAHARAVPDLPKFPRNFMETLSPDQLRLLGNLYRSDRLNAMPSMHPAAPRRAQTPGRSSNTAVSGYAPRKPNGRARAVPSPTSTTQCGEPGPQPRMGIPEYFVIPDLRVGRADQLPGPSQPYYCTSGGKAAE